MTGPRTHQDLYQGMPAHPRSVSSGAAIARLVAGARGGARGTDSGDPSLAPEAKVPGVAVLPRRLSRARDRRRGLAVRRVRGQRALWG